MTTSYQTIAELPQEKIKEINQFLQDIGRPVFTESQLDFLANHQKLDVLDLVDNIQCVRGFFAEQITLLGACLINVNKDNQSLNKLVADYTASLNRDEYEEEDYQNLISEYATTTKQSIFAYGVILNSCSCYSTDMLFLNSEFSPLEVNAVNLLA